MELNQVNALIAERLVKGTLGSYEVTKNGEVTRFSIRQGGFEGAFSFGHAEKKFAFLGARDLNTGKREWHGFDAAAATDTLQPLLSQFEEATARLNDPTDQE